MRKVKERQTYEDIGKIRSRITRIIERRGLNHPPFGEIHFSKDKESKMTSWHPSRMEKREGNRLNVGDVEEITSKDFALSRVKAQGMHITSKRRIQ